MPEISILVKAKDEVSSVLNTIMQKFGELDETTLKMMGLAAGAIGAVGAGISKLAWDAAQVEPVRRTFEALTGEIGATGDEMLDALRPATLGMVGDLDLMQAANKLMILGLADSKEEAAELANMAVTLGTAMGKDALGSLEEFTNMLGTQSVYRMQEFGLSGDEAKETVKDLKDELGVAEAFKLAVLEQGNERMDTLGSLTDTAFVKLGNLQSGFGNVKDELGEALLPTLNKLLDEALVPISESLIELAPLLETTLPEAIGPLVEALQALAGAVKPFLDALKWIDEHRDVIDLLARIGQLIMNIGMPLGMIPEVLREGRLPIPGALSIEEIQEPWREYAPEPTPEGGGRRWNINVYGMNTVEDTLRTVDAIERHTVGSIAGP